MREGIIQMQKMKNQSTNLLLGQASRLVRPGLGRDI
jgi:hypothetical protein